MNNHEPRKRRLHRFLHGELTPLSLLVLVLLLLLLGWLANGARAAETEGRILEGPAAVVDGDTIRIGETRIRLAGIDAPERKQTCRRSDGRAWRAGMEAAAGLGKLLGGAGPVTCRDTGFRSHDRVVAVCFLDRANDPAGPATAARFIDLADVLVVSGLAFRDPRYDTAGRYVEMEATARAAKVGIWQGECEAPWEWRKRNR